MIYPVSSFNSNSRVNSFRGDLPTTTNSPKSETSKKGMTNTEKALVGLGAAAAIVIGGILVKKHLDSKAVDAAAEQLTKVKDSLPIPKKDMLEKPKEFSKEYLQDIATDWYKKGLVKPGDKICCIPKSQLEAYGKISEDYTKGLKEMNMSDNGFMIFVQKADESVDYSTIRYLDPETNTFLKMVNNLKNDKIFIIKNLKIKSSISE